MRQELDFRAALKKKASPSALLRDRAAPGHTALFPSVIRVLMEPNAL